MVHNIQANPTTVCKSYMKYSPDNPSMVSLENVFVSFVCTLHQIFLSTQDSLQKHMNKLKDPAMVRHELFSIWANGIATQAIPVDPQYVQLMK